MLVMIDLDNTLADRDGAVRAWIAEFQDEHGLSPADAAWIHELDNDGYSTRRDVFETIASRFSLAPTVDELLSRYQRRVVELIQATPGAERCLRELRALDHSIAIVSNGSSTQQRSKIDTLGLEPLVDTVCISGDLGIKKPDPRIFRIAAERTGQTLDSAWMVGDSAHHDIVAAQELGIATAWLHRGRPWEPALPRPTLVLDSLAQLVAGLSDR